uniref:NADH dehydrogenase [ubiquinone] 1 alpha subcomplex subunit 12 n=1 Tax=Trichuris muris TaxID=70415 RepID=A0A5S6R1C9_TRIMR
MAKRPGIFAYFWKSVLSSLQRKRPQHVVIGRDSFGNVYYETGRSTSTGSVRRGYIPSNADNWNQVPVEWRCWLSRLRNDPPTQHEIDYNNLQTAQRVKAGNKLGEPTVSASDELVQPSDHCIFGKSNFGQTSSFPRYPELEQHATNLPGRKE